MITLCCIAAYSYTELSYSVYLCHSVWTYKKTDEVILRTTCTCMYVVGEHSFCCLGFET